MKTWKIRRVNGCGMENISGETLELAILRALPVYAGLFTDQTRNNKIWNITANPDGEDEILVECDSSDVNGNVGHAAMRVYAGPEECPEKIGKWVLTRAKTEFPWDCPWKARTEDTNV